LGDDLLERRVVGIDIVGQIREQARSRNLLA